MLNHFGPCWRCVLFFVLIGIFLPNIFRAFSYMKFVRVSACMLTLVSRDMFDSKSLKFCFNVSLYSVTFLRQRQFTVENC